MKIHVSIYVKHGTCACIYIITWHYPNDNFNMAYARQKKNYHIISLRLKKKKIGPTDSVAFILSISDRGTISMGNWLLDAERFLHDNVCYPQT